MKEDDIPPPTDMKMGIATVDLLTAVVVLLIQAVALLEAIKAKK